MPPCIGETGVVEVTRFSPTGNAHIEIGNEEHLNIGCIDCDVGDSVKVKRLDEVYCRCLCESTGPDNYEFRLSMMRKHHNETDSDQDNVGGSSKSKNAGQKSGRTLKMVKFSRRKSDGRQV